MSIISAQQAHILKREVSLERPNHWFFLILAKHKKGSTRIWTGDLSICSRIPCHWPITPTATTALPSCVPQTTIIITRIISGDINRTTNSHSEVQRIEKEDLMQFAEKKTHLSLFNICNNHEDHVDWTDTHAAARDFAKEAWSLIFSDTRET